ncbi:zinc transport system substrate-binding protein [Seinonella peptonophila]|uniref:Zinc transport system substrate-binding protein n=1 Tax=Seinonella peptonophila TaxID=112248 RepID=A0A1M4X6L7_9BACL|nr:zinc ABC transporter substrate-binding protein [Seinonella peptonophila]SHE89119.1 zinc transport system substrate-binding protein [Seinonella peptonophila]
MFISRKVWYMLLLISMIIISGCQTAQIPTKQPGKLLIYTSIYPIEYFAKRIGGNQVQVHNLVPPGVEPHDFELLPKQRAALQEADLILYNGGGFENWLEKVKQSDSNQKRWVEVSKGLLTIAEREGAEHEKEEHGHGVDPHIWLDPALAKKQAEQITQALMKVDEKHKDTYQKNMDQLAKQFDQLDQSFQQMVNRAGKKEFVVSHSAFAYLAKKYGLEQIAVSGISPVDEPSAKELTSIVQTMQAHQLKYIFFETLVHPKVAQTIQREAHATVLTLNPLEGLTKKEMDQGSDYFTVMEQNRQNLAKALESQ